MRAARGRSGALRAAAPSRRADLRAGATLEDLNAEPSSVPEEAQPPPPSRRAWIWVALLLIAAAVVGLIIGSTLGGRQAGPLANQTGGTGRPTIVVGTVAAAPSAV